MPGEAIVTLTLHDLAEFRRREMDGPNLVEPPANFLQDLKEYYERTKAAAGPAPINWAMDAEVLAAMDVVQDIFRIRRGKLARAVETCSPPSPKQMFEFESCAWFGFLRVYQLLDKTTERICIEGTWSGRWGE
jgi:hypothetical protein